MLREESPRTKAGTCACAASQRKAGLGFFSFISRPRLLPTSTPRKVAPRPIPCFFFRQTRRAVSKRVAIRNLPSVAFPTIRSPGPVSQKRPLKLRSEGRRRLHRRLFICMRSTRFSKLRTHSAAVSKPYTTDNARIRLMTTHPLSLNHFACTSSPRASSTVPPPPSQLGTDDTQNEADSSDNEVPFNFSHSAFSLSAYLNNADSDLASATHAEVIANREDPHLVETLFSQEDPRIRFKASNLRYHLHEVSLPSSSSSTSSEVYFGDSRASRLGSASVLSEEQEESFTYRENEAQEEDTDHDVTEVIKCEHCRQLFNTAEVQRHRRTCNLRSGLRFTSGVQADRGRERARVASSRLAHSGPPTYESRLRPLRSFCISPSPFRLLNTAPQEGLPTAVLGRQQSAPLSSTLTAALSPATRQDSDSLFHRRTNSFSLESSRRRAGTTAQHQEETRAHPPTNAGPTPATLNSRRPRRLPHHNAAYLVRGPLYCPVYRRPTTATTTTTTTPPTGRRSSPPPWMGGILSVLDGGGPAGGAGENRSSSSTDGIPGTGTTAGSHSTAAAAHRSLTRLSSRTDVSSRDSHLSETDDEEEEEGDAQAAILPAAHDTAGRAFRAARSLPSPTHSNFVQCPLCRQLVHQSVRDDHLLAHRLQAREDWMAAEQDTFHEMARLIATRPQDLMERPVQTTSVVEARQPPQPPALRETFEELAQRFSGPSSRFALLLHARLASLSNPSNPEPVEGTPANAIASLPVSTYAPSNDDQPSHTESADQSCMVCLEDYVPGESLRRLPCMHLFHMNCIDQWLRRSTLCPACKQPVVNRQEQEQSSSLTHSSSSQSSSISDSARPSTQVTRRMFPGY